MNETWAASLYNQYYAEEWARGGLFAAVAQWLPAQRVLYPGSYIHTTASFYFQSVTYVDNNKVAKRFFAQRAQVLSIVEANKAYAGTPYVQFIFADYEKPLPLPDFSFDLLFSLYAGFVSAPCKRYLAHGGFLVANDSHGDASLAYLDPDYELVGALTGRGDRLHFNDSGLADYFKPKGPLAPSEAIIRERRRGLSYVKTAVAYLFRRV